MNAQLHVAIALACLTLPTALTATWVTRAEARLAENEAAADPDETGAPLASADDRSYCTPELKRVLRRVLQSCGLAAGGAARGCQPADAKNVAALAGDDFNALFLPLSDRAGILQFDQDSAELDAQDAALLDRLFSDQQGASWFFVVSRASPEGSELHNRALSQRRGDAVLDHLRTTFEDPALDESVGLLWLGEEFAQLDPSTFCAWQRSGDTEACQQEHLNRSAFVAWIDCTL